MSESRISQALRKIFQDAGSNVLEERMADYIVRELHAGRDLSEILEDPYIKNHAHGDHIMHVFENKQVLEEFEAHIKESISRM